MTAAGEPSSKSSKSAHLHLPSVSYHPLLIFMLRTFPFLSPTSHHTLPVSCSSAPAAAAAASTAAARRTHARTHATRTEEVTGVRCSVPVRLSPCSFPSFPTTPVHRSPRHPGIHPRSGSFQLLVSYLFHTLSNSPFSFTFPFILVLHPSRVLSSIFIFSIAVAFPSFRISRVQAILRSAPANIILNTQYLNACDNDNDRASHAWEI